LLLGYGESSVAGMLAIVATVVGVVLSVANFWLFLQRARLRLKVVPRGWVGNNGMSGLCIEVVNLGEYAVTITGVGIALRGKEKLDWTFIPIAEMGGSYPSRLQPRDAVTFYARAGAEEDIRLRAGTVAYAKTACGSRIRGNSVYLRSVIRKAAHLD